MPVPSALTARTATPEGRQGAVTPTIPFVRAALRQTLPGGVDVLRAITAAAQNFGTFEIPATGWLRGIELLVTATGGTGTVAVAQADAPWSAIDTIELTDPAGGQIFGPVSGYELMLANFAGGYANRVDPATYGSTQLVQSSGDFRFRLRVPVEASIRDGYASLTNQDASAAYRLRVGLSPASSIYSTNPTTFPTVRLQAAAEVWTQPKGANLFGQPQETSPPGAGTIQFWTREITSLVSGANQPRIRRVGNLIRTLVLITRTSAGARVANTDLPDPIRILWDTLSLTDEQRLIRLDKMEAAYGTAFPAGVFVYTYADDLDYKPGGELRNALLPTTPATRLNFEGSWGAGAGGGTLTVLINDILPVSLA